MFDFASYHRAATLADAINLLVDNPQAKLLAGGTDVLIQLHHHNDRYRHIVDIHNLAELRGELRWRKMAHYVSALQRHLPSSLKILYLNVISRRYVLRPHPLPDRRSVTSLPTVEIFATVPPAQILPRQR